jgi:hypothetical protein
MVPYLGEPCRSELPARIDVLAWGVRRRQIRQSSTRFRHMTTTINDNAAVKPRAETSGRRYEDLDGGNGSEVNFRPQRYLSSELSPIVAVVTLGYEEQHHHCDLHDVSQNGVAFEWSGSRPFAVGDTLTLVSVSFDGHAAYRGAVRVGSVRVAAGRQIVGASLLGTLIDIDKVLQLRDVKAWSAAGPAGASNKAPWRLAGHEQFRSLVADLRLLFEDAEQQLDQLEASLPRQLVHGDQDVPARAALVERVRSEVVDEIRSVYLAIGALPRPVTLAEQQAMKEYSFRNLHEYFTRSPWLRRARDKPLGYPGDYELMNGIYGQGAYAGFSGSTLFAKAVNLLVTEAPSAVSVVERKNLIRQRLSELLEARRPAGRPLRILSLAAGPAQETYELLDACKSVPHPVEIVLFDQDKQALAFAYQRLQPIVSARWPNDVRIVYLHDTIKRLLRDPRLFASFGGFDTIFSCGLFDYLPRPTAATLTGSLFANLAPQGCLYIGNQTPLNPSRWAMEFHCDWYLIYREHAEMLDFATAGAPSAQLAIEQEATGINPFVALTRA